jgi:hypothetical protein
MLILCLSYFITTVSFLQASEGAPEEMPWAFFISTIYDKAQLWT